MRSDHPNDKGARDIEDNVRGKERHETDVELVASQVEVLGHPVYLSVGNVGPVGQLAYLACQTSQFAAYLSMNDSRNMIYDAVSSAK